MYVTLDQYKALGYAIVPDNAFQRYAQMAEAAVRKYTQNRISDADLSDMNRLGVCEVIDRYYVAHNPNSEAAVAQRVLTHFTNGGYSESYLGEQRSDVESAAPESLGVDDVMALYFTADQLWRCPHDARRP